MLFLPQQRIVFLANTKSASSSIEAALRRWAGIAITAPPALKHMNYRAFMEEVAPMIERRLNLGRANYEVVCVMREPLSWVHSWYRYRSRSELRDPTDERHGNYSGRLSFSEYVRLYCSADPPAPARISTQVAMLLGESGSIGVDRVFPYERLDGLLEYLGTAVGATINLPTANVSPAAEFDLDVDADQLLRVKLRADIELHSRLRPDGLVD
jgi:hypothetical protein